MNWFYFSDYFSNICCLIKIEILYCVISFIPFSFVYNFFFFHFLWIMCPPPPDDQVEICNFHTENYLDDSILSVSSLYRFEVFVYTAKRQWNMKNAVHSNSYLKVNHCMGNLEWSGNWLVESWCPTHMVKHTCQ